MRLFGLLGVLGFNKSLQVGEAQLPEVAILIEPAVDGAERLGIKLVDAMPSFAMFANQMSAPQKAEVLRDGGAGDRERSGNCSGRLSPAAQ
jgi:hypothetical protein